MFKAALSAGAIAVLAVVMLVSRAPRDAEAATLFVFNPSDSGFGTLRWAVDQANGNASIDRIVVKTTVPITLYSPVVYEGSQTLMVQGDHPLLYRIIQGGGAQPGALDNGCALFMSVGGADITFYQLVFRNSWCNGIDVLSDGYDGEVAVTLNKVIVEHNDGKGVYIAEALNGVGVAIPAATSFKVIVTSSFIRDNGHGCKGDVCERAAGAGDGIVVDETGDGGIAATCTGSSFTGNNGDGLELYEEGAGNVTFTATNCQFNGNENLELEGNATAAADDDASAEVIDDSWDGLRIEEQDNGDVTVTLNSPVIANGNQDDGIDVRERGEGKFSVTGTGVTADGNGSEGVDILEDEGGNLTVKLTNTKTWNNGGEGVEVDERGGGDLSVDISNSSANFNSSDGYDLDESEDGKLTAKFQTVVANANEDGFELDEAGTGAYSATIFGSTAQGNGDDAVQAEAGDETGTIAFGTSTLIGNIELTNINVIP